ncbi:MAG: 23S rRNA (guanosine(2251)-2'-O)-methyltransferase RlmB [Bacteroidota bacterium]|nr:23S rRNA (guanosine(2251)-2'-O)-methyltransferase RlmB [Candidatus Kapabacteria bacterium]MDW8074193.1 23S rRNA (guanosine(2251)-2'-O)-methyltransferase RlmB [Bacteroidota bacterium]
MANHLGNTDSIYLTGINPILTALREHAPIEKIFLRYGSDPPDEILRRARHHGIPFAVLSREKFDHLVHQIGAFKHHQNIIALRRIYQTVEWSECLASVSSVPPPCIVACDQITDPHNFGAIVRTAAAAGAEAVLTTLHNSAPMTPATIAASSGAFERIPIVRVRSLLTALAAAKEKGFWIIGTAHDGEHLYTEHLYDRPVIVVIGSEGHGMRRSIRRLCDAVVRIPLARSIESLNASVAAGVVLFELRRQRSTTEAVAGASPSATVPAAQGVPSSMHASARDAQDLQRSI